MRQIILLAVVLIGTNSWGRGLISGGTGVEGRARQEINPQLTEGQVLPHFFAQYRLWPFAVSVEGGVEERDTSSGALQINSRTLTLGAWGRYEFLTPLYWSPFATLGGGYNFDTVTSRFNSESDTRSGSRGFVGAGGGIAHVLWTHFLMEAELRAALVQDRVDAAYSAIVRVGFVM